MGAARKASAVAAAAVVAAVMLAGTAAAAEYQVGDKAGWTIMGSPNYTAWAIPKQFHLGDAVVFTYSKQFHNVMAVSKADYKNCGVRKPIATWSTGNDTVVLNTTGHHYFLCGFPSHCAAGQKVDIRVASSAAPSTAPSMEPSPASGAVPAAGGATAAAPSPRTNAANAPAAGFSVAMALAVSLLAAAGLNLL